jgi:pimeloyl-ACP methyl ester carboxylesterase
MEFAKRLAKEGFAVLTYDKRGVGESGGLYAGPSVGTNNIDNTNLNLLAQDASSAVNTFQTYLKDKKIPIGLIGFSQAGWIIPIAANKNPQIKFMVLFSCPTITTLEQLRFQFYTNGNDNFWENHTEADAREHIKNDVDRYQFTATDPKIFLNSISIPGLWLFGEKDIQIPVKLCIEQLNTLKAEGKPFEYTLFSKIGHNTVNDNYTVPFDISIQWIKQKTLNIKKSKLLK